MCIYTIKKYNSQGGDVTQPNVPKLGVSSVLGITKTTKGGLRGSTAIRHSTNYKFFFFFFFFF